jgi:phosphosulfolactate synthase
VAEPVYPGSATKKFDDGPTEIRHTSQDLEAGAAFVTTEARESGHSGICDASGTLRYGVIDKILGSAVDCERLWFEAPTKELQTFFTTRLGTNVNLADVALLDVIGVGTLRLGLRSDTLLHFELERRHLEEVSLGA